MARATVLLALLTLTSCSYYVTHKLWTGGEEVKDWKSYEKHQTAMKAFEPRGINWKYVQGAGREYQLKITQMTRQVPRTVAVEARGHHAEIRGVSVFARHPGNPLEPDRRYSDPLASDVTRTIIQDSGWVRVSTFENVFKHQPTDPREIQIWFKLITYFLHGDDYAEVRVLFDGREIGSRKVTFQEAAPNTDPDTGPWEEERKRILDEQE